MSDQMLGYLVPEMQKVYLQENPKYIASRDRDFKALREIAAFICEQMGTAIDPFKYKAEILLNWKQLAKTAAADPFYRQKSLATISNHIQEIAQKTRDGDNSKKQPGITPDELRNELDDHFR